MIFEKKEFKIIKQKISLEIRVVISRLYPFEENLRTWNFSRKFTKFQLFKEKKNNNNKTLEGETIDDSS